jgi:hypothetical protein
MTSREDEVARVLFHRALAGHTPHEVCEECPQPITRLLLWEGTR